MFFINVGDFVKGQEAGHQDNIEDFFSAAKRDKTQQDMNLFNIQQPGQQAAASVESDTLVHAANTIQQQNLIPQLAGGRVSSLVGNAALQDLAGVSAVSQANALHPLVPQLTNLRAITELQRARNAQGAASLIPQQQLLQQGQTSQALTLLPQDTTNKVARQNLVNQQIQGQVQTLPGQVSNTLLQQGLTAEQIAAQRQTLPGQTRNVINQQGLTDQQIQGQVQTLPGQTRNIVAQQGLTAEQIAAQRQTLPGQTTNVISQQDLTAEQIAAQRQTLPLQTQVAVNTANQNIQQQSQVATTRQTQLEAQQAQALQQQALANAQKARLSIGELMVANTQSAAKKVADNLIASGTAPAGSTVTKTSGNKWVLNILGGQTIPIESVATTIDNAIKPPRAAKKTKAEKSTEAELASLPDMSTIMGDMSNVQLTPPSVQAAAGGGIAESTLAGWRTPGSAMWKEAEKRVKLSNTGLNLSTAQLRNLTAQEVEKYIQQITGG